jgi:hypothetical protein
LVVVVLACTLATLLFASMTMGWFRVRSRWWETVTLAAAVALLFRPDFFMDRIAPEFRDLPPAQVFDIARDAPDGGRLAMVIAGMTLEGEDVVKTVAVRLGARPADGADGHKRLAEAGLLLMPLGDPLQMSQVRFGSRAQKGGFEQGWEVRAVKAPTGRPTPHWFYLPALLLAGLVWRSQGRRFVA